MPENRKKRGKAYFSISAVAKMFSVHQQTVRLYEKEGLIQPQRSEGNTRMFSEEDIEKLEEIIHLTHQLGINLAGVEMILQLQQKMKKMQKEMNKLFTSTQNELSIETNARKSLIKSYSKELALKREEATPTKFQSEDAPRHDNSSISDWDIDYEE